MELEIEGFLIEPMSYQYKSSDLDRMTFEQGFCFNYKSSSDKLPKHYVFNDKATILLWEDGTKTIVRKTEQDNDDKKLAFLIAYFQKHSGLSKTKANDYLDNIVEELVEE